MPDSKVTITPTFSKIEDTKPSKTGFNDVASSAWYADAVQYVTDKGLMNGTDDNQFSPNASTTRGMLMTVLHATQARTPPAALPGTRRA